MPEAAEALGVTQSAVWQRIRRGTIHHEKDSNGKTYVFIDPSVTKANPLNDESPDVLRDTLFKAMQDQIETLKREVEDWKEEARRKDHIIMTMAQRIPELEPPRGTPPEPRESPEAASEAGSSSGMRWAIVMMIASLRRASSCQTSSCRRR